MSDHQWDSPLGVRRRLVLASALMLFIELALIRWSGSNIVHLSYFSNFVLLGSFLGIGLGFLRASPTHRLPWYSPIALALPSRRWLNSFKTSRTTATSPADAIRPTIVLVWSS